MAGKYITPEEADRGTLQRAKEIVEGLNGSIRNEHYAVLTHALNAGSRLADKVYAFDRALNWTPLQKRWIEQNTPKTYIWLAAPITWVGVNAMVIVNATSRGQAIYEAILSIHKAYQGTVLSFSEDFEKYIQRCSDALARQDPIVLDKDNPVIADTPQGDR